VTLTAYDLLKDRALTDGDGAVLVKPVLDCVHGIDLLWPCLGC